MPIVYKFARAPDFKLCLALLEADATHPVHNCGNDVIAAESLTLREVHLLDPSGIWTPVTGIDTVYSIIALGGAAVFHMDQSVVSYTPGKGFHAFTSPSAPHFAAYQAHFAEQLSLLRAARYGSSASGPSHSA
jgi:hypothetical protein